MSPLSNNESITRAAHICKVGAMKLHIIYSEDKESFAYASPRQRSQIDQILKSLGVYTSDLENADVCAEYRRPEFDCRPFDGDYILSSKPCDNLPPANITGAKRDLLKVAYERMGFEPYEVAIIEKIAGAAAYLSGDKEAKIEDVAEAIHYRSFDR